MTQFFKKFLADEGSRLSLENGRFFALGAFGKHPGWDDHIEDLGLETESLTAAKLLLYVKGVGGQIDTGAWEKLAPADRLDSFDHTFVWLRGPQLLLGRLWSSTDGKGRSRYPMVICAQCIGASVGWTLENVLPRLKEVEQECKNTVNAAEVRSILDHARSALRGRLVHAGPAAQGGAPDAGLLQRFVTDPVFGPSQQGWYRLLYHVQNQMAAFAAGKFNPKGDLSGLRSQPMRVPLGSVSPEEALSLWARLLSARFDRAVPVFLAVSPATQWVDVVVGEPSSHDLFGLRARPAALPLVTEVPYEMSEAFMADARTALSEFQNGKEALALPRAEAPSSQTPAEETGGWISVTQRWFKGKTGKLWLVLCIIALLGAAGTIFIFSARRSPSLAPDQLADAKHAKPTGAADAPAREREQPAAVTALPTSPPASLPPTPPARAQAVSTPKPENPAPPPVSIPVAAPAVVTAPPNTVLPAKDEPSAKPVAPAVMVAATNAPPMVPATEEKSKTTNEAPAALAQAVEPKPLASVPAAADAGTTPRKGLTNSIGMILLWIAALPGTTEGGYVSQYEVTQREFERVAGSNPSHFKNPLQPVESVTWSEANDFCRKLTALDKIAGALPEGFVYALPTQAQWDFFLGDAQFDDSITSRNSLRETPAPVGSLRPNRYGLYDVLGNVWEYCADSGAGDKVLKGAAYNNRKLSADWKPLERTTARRLPANARAPDAGLRCVAFHEP